LIRHQKSRLLLPLLFFFFNSSMEVLERVWSYPMNHISSKARFIPLLKSKQQLNTHKHAGSRTAAQKTTKRNGPGDARPCALDARPCIPHHGPWWALFGAVRTLLERRVLSYFGPRDWPWTLPALGLLGYFASTLFTWLDSKSYFFFSHKLGPIHADLQ